MLGQSDHHVNVVLVSITRTHHGLTTETSWIHPDAVPTEVRRRLGEGA
ncbi:hypothetical protein [Sphingobacterium sp. BIGb0165]|nr:hypothetical protein [Sphingobacterium sp. BIGb0165]MCS4227118.1 hypothetical protein [Sphingobacterium sp. BIGb0165]